MTRNITAEDHVAHFKTLVVKSGLKEENDLIAKFQRSITPRLRRIVSYKEEPTTILGWYKAAIAADNTDRRINEDIDRFKRENPKPTPATRTSKYYNSSNNYSNTYRQPYRDPNTMDVDAINLSPEERNKRMKQGQCFTCGEPGHRARDHNDPNFKRETLRTALTHPELAINPEIDRARDRPDPEILPSRSEDSPRSTEPNYIKKCLAPKMKTMKIFLFLSRRCPGVPSYTISDPPSLFCRIQPKNDIPQD